MTSHAASTRPPRGQVLELAVLVAYCALAATPFVVATANGGFWDSAVAWAAAALWLLLVGALVARRRWAWIVLLVFEAAVLLSFAFDFTGVLQFIASLASVGLLASPPMRRHVGRPRSTPTA